MQSFKNVNREYKDTLFRYIFSEKKPCLEVTATVLNINYGNNREIMEKCRKLQEYSKFIAFVKSYLAKGMSIAQALDMAAENALREDILRDILQKQRAEVLKMFMRDFDEEKYMQQYWKEPDSV